TEQSPQGSVDECGQPTAGSASLGLPYWTQEYVHLGPFRLTRLDPGEGITFEAYDRYFLGRPKVDVIRVRSFGEKSVLYTNLLAGAVDLFPNVAIASNLGFQLDALWRTSGEGTVVIIPGGSWGLFPQFRPEYQAEPANLDPKV